MLRCIRVWGLPDTERFLEFPLTEEATHPYFGGFLKHTINVANLADMALTICEGSPNEVIRPDPSLVIAGALLHASGVLSQLTLSAAEGIFTDRARLLSSSTECGFNGSLHKQPIRTGETSYGYVRTFTYSGSCQWNDTA